MFKKTLKATNCCRFLLPKIKELESKYKHKRKNIVEVATKFYRELYADIVSENLTEEERHKWKELC